MQAGGMMHPKRDKGTDSRKNKRRGGENIDKTADEEQVLRQKKMREQKEDCETPKIKRSTCCAFTNDRQ